MIRERLWNGDVLRILFSEGLGFDVWVEKYGNPPRVFFEGRALPIDQLEEVLRKLESYCEDPGTKLSWNQPNPSVR